MYVVNDGKSWEFISGLTFSAVLHDIKTKESSTSNSRLNKPFTMTLWCLFEFAHFRFSVRVLLCQTDHLVFCHALKRIY
jgi:hypothetical protein